MELRRHDIDWLRVLASYFVVVYHTAQFFDFQKKTYIKNENLSLSMDLFTQFVHIWHLPVFFLVAGWSLKVSLVRRGASKVLAERFRKLFIPLVFGLLFLCAPPQWVALKHGLLRRSTGESVSAEPSISFLKFVRERYYVDGVMSWNHLWFLAYLFTFTVLYMPGFMILSRFSLLMRFNAERCGWWLTNIPVIPLVLVQATLRERWPGYQNLVDDWANFAFYSLFFISGFCLAQCPALEYYLYTKRERNLIIGFLSFIFCVSPSVFNGPMKYPSVSQRYWFALAAWYMVVSLLGFARHAFSGTTPPSFWCESAFPVYILHDLPLSLLADTQLGSWSAPPLLKFLCLTVQALFLTLLLLHTFVYKVALLRFLLGIKSSSSSSLREVG